MSSVPESLELKEQALKGRLAIVTGTTRGIGLAVTLSLLQRGCSVLGIYRVSHERSDAISKLASTLSNNVQYHGVKSDIVHPSEAVPSVTSALGEKFPNCKVDIIVNNASRAPLVPLASITSEELQNTLNANVVFPTLLVQALLPSISKKGRGRIINVSSEASHLGRVNATAYSASKSALESLTRSWAKELGQEYGGLTANNVCPGLVDTDLWKALPDARKQYWSEKAKETPVAPRIASAQEVADAVVWFAGDESKWVSGATLAVNGGSNMLA